MLASPGSLLRNKSVTFQTRVFDRIFQDLSHSALPRSLTDHAGQRKRLLFCLERQRQGEGECERSHLTEKRLVEFARHRRRTKASEIESVGRSVDRSIG